MRLLFVCIIFPFSFYVCGQLPPGAHTSRGRVVISDIKAFWKTYDRFWQDTTQNPFEEYLRNGSAGLQDFIPYRIKSARALKATVKLERAYYDQVRATEADLDRLRKDVDQTFSALENILPDVKLPDVYFVIGRLTSGGTATENGLIIGYETFSRDAVATGTGRKAIPFEWIPAVVAHELVHFQQAYPVSENTLLAMVLREGCADFIAELAGYPNVRYVNGDAYAYGDEHERELWRKFERERTSRDYASWLYNLGSSTDVPPDLGYWMGYMICKEYYHNAVDKGQALKDMLCFSDAEEFLLRSGYGLKFN